MMTWPFDQSVNACASESIEVTDAETPSGSLCRVASVLVAEPRIVCLFILGLLPHSSTGTCMPSRVHTCVMHGEWSDDDLQHEVSEGRWVADNVNAVPKTTVGTLVPVGFDAYARILFPRVGRGSEQLAVISRLLAEHTGTPHDCWFALWEGNTALDEIRDSTPSVQIAGYNYILLRGPVERAIDSYRGLRPNIWWPADHSWCMAPHFDFPYAFLGASNQCISDLFQLSEIEAR